MLPPVVALGEPAFALIAHFHVFYHDVTLRGVSPLTRGRGSKRDLVRARLPASKGAG